MTEGKIKPIKVEKVKLTLKTCGKWGSSSDDPVKLDIGEYSWDLNHPFCDDFEKGKKDVFELEVPEGMDSTAFHYLCLKKDKDIRGGRWCLYGIKLEINDEVVYEGSSLEAWLEGGKTRWCAPDFEFGPKVSISPDYD